MDKKLTIIVAIVLALGLIGASIGIGYYYGYAIKYEVHDINYYIDRYPTYYDAKVAMFKDQNKSIHSVDVCFLGDSLTDMCDTTNLYKPYKTINRGISGDTTFGLEDRLDVSAYAVNPKVVFMLIGINNIANMLDNYESIVVKLKQNLPNTKIFILSLTPTTGFVSSLNDQVVEKNVSVKEIAERNNCTYVDIHTALLDHNTSELKEEYTSDGLHFSSKGYDVIASILKPLMKDSLGK